jgi:hypothetical protein
LRTASTATRISPLTPLKGGAIAAATWGTVAGVINLRRYQKGRLSGRDAALDTATQSAGVGVSAASGLVAGNAARAALVAATTTATAPVVLPFATAVVASAGVKYVWDTVIVPKTTSWLRRR